MSMRTSPPVSLDVTAPGEIPDETVDEQVAPPFVMTSQHIAALMGWQVRTFPALVVPDYFY